MNSILRKVRKKLLSENKFSRYFLYAIGEVFLVVIGILIALWLNNLNESRKNNRIEKDILIALQSEVQENQISLSGHIQQHQETVRLLAELNNRISPSPEPITNKRMDSLMYALGLLPSYNPSDKTLNSVHSTGQIALIQNKQLNAFLSTSSHPLKRYRRNAQWVEKQYFEIITPYIKDKYPAKQITSMYYKGASDPSKFEYSKEKLLSDMGFESLVANRLIDAKGILHEAEELYEFQNNILTLLKDEIAK